MRRYIQGVLAATVLATTACSGGLGGLGEVLGSPSPSVQTGQLSAEIRSVDTRNQQIQVTTSDNRTTWVAYDQNTAVVYRQQQYNVSALESGDIVILNVQQDSRGNLYASRIDVTQSVQDRTGNVYEDSRVRVFTGRIRSIDHTRGSMVMQTQSGDMTVTLPYNPPRATSDYFHRLRAGDSVSLEAIPTGSSRAEIYRFL